jgi:hypothetical protein
MGLGVSIVLIAVGAILRWAVTASTSGVNLHVIGLILMVVGILGLVLSLIFWASIGRWTPASRSTAVRERRYDDDYTDRAA